MRGHIQKLHDTLYRFVIDEGQDPATGKRKQRWYSGYKTRKEAEEALNERLGQIRLGTYVPPSKQTVGEYLREWLDAIRPPRVRSSTWASYRMNIEKHVIPQLGALPLQSLTASRLNAFYADLLRDGRRVKAGRPPGLSGRTVRYIHAIVRKALADAVRWNKLTRNVADQADPPSQKATRSHERPTWTTDEVRAFLDHVRDDRLYAAWRLVATTGLRRGELLGLLWEDVDLKAALPRIEIRQTLITIGEKIYVSSPKTAKGYRTIILDRETADALRAHQAEQLRERVAHVGYYQDHGLVFCREDGSQLHPNVFSDWFYRHARAAGLPRIRFHDFRHTYATLGLEAGENPRVISERLGHASVAITLDIYSHVTPKVQRESAERVAALISA